MGPGGYRFSDYPRLGLPLSVAGRSRRGADALPAGKKYFINTEISAGTGIDMAAGRERDLEGGGRKGAGRPRPRGAGGAGRAGSEGPPRASFFEAGARTILWSVAEGNLKDADLWPQILQLSGIVGSPAQVAGRGRRAGAAGGRRRLRRRLSPAAFPEGHGRGARIFAPVEDRHDNRHRDTAVDTATCAPRAEVVGYAASDRNRRPRARRSRARPARPGGGGGRLGHPGQRRGPRADQRAGRRGRPRTSGRVRAAAHALASTAQVTFRDLSRLPAEPELRRHDPADAQRPADRRRGDQGQPGQRRLLRAPEPARRPHRLRGGGAGARDRDPVRRLLGQARRRESASPTTMPPRSRSPARRRSASARTRAPWCPTPAPPSAPGCFRDRLAAPFDGADLRVAVTLAWRPAEGAEG